MIKLEINIVIITIKGERKIGIRKIIGEFNDTEKPPKGRTSPP